MAENGRANRHGARLVAWYPDVNRRGKFALPWEDDESSEQHRKSACPSLVVPITNTEGQETLLSMQEEGSQNHARYGIQAI